MSLDPAICEQREPVRITTMLEVIEVIVLALRIVTPVVLTIVLIVSNEISKMVPEEQEQQ